MTLWIQYHKIINLSLDKSFLMQPYLIRYIYPFIKLKRTYYLINIIFFYSKLFNCRVLLTSFCFDLFQYVVTYLLLVSNFLSNRSKRCYLNCRELNYALINVISNHSFPFICLQPDCLRFLCRKKDFQEVMAEILL